MVFREGRTKAVGNVTKLFPHISAVAQNTRQQRAQKKAQDGNHCIKPQNEPQKASKKTRSRFMYHRGPQPSIPSDERADVAKAETVT